MERAEPPAGGIATWFGIVDGERREAIGGERLDVVAPSDGGVFASIPRGREKDVDAAVAAARAALVAGPWARLSATERGRLLARLSLLVGEHGEDLAGLESRDTGKPISQARADMVALARYFEFYAGAADKLMGETIPISTGYTALTLREPLGVVGSIVPWNYPAQILGRVAGAALAAGNTLVVKPAEDACLSVIRVAELALEAGFPAGVFNVVTGLGAEAGAALAGHANIDFVTFTGSPEVGTLVQQAAAVNHVGCTLELGGKSPQVVFADADLDAAVPVLVKAIIQNAGQTCSAGSRILVERSIYEEVVARLAERFRALVAGPGDADLDLGPLVSEKQRGRVAGHVAAAIAEGIPVAARGTIAANAPATGSYHEAVLLAPVPPAAQIWREEVFGPVLCVTPFDDERQAIDLANATPYGLVAAVWTVDGARQLRCARAIRAGQVFVNGYGAGGGVELPFGGVKRSGHGREKGFEALLEFTAAKTIVLAHG